MAQKLVVIAGEISKARTVLRLYDGLPMLRHTLKYGCGSQESSQTVGRLNAIANFAIQLFYPFEAISWASKLNILPIEGTRFGVACTACWAIYLVAGIIRGFVKIRGIKKRRALLRKEKFLESKSGREDHTEQSDSFKQSMRSLAREEISERLQILQNMADFMNAINFLPAGFLWSSKFTTQQSGFFGLISTFLMLYSILKQQMSASKLK